MEVDRRGWGETFWLSVENVMTKAVEKVARICKYSGYEFERKWSWVTSNRLTEGLEHRRSTDPPPEISSSPDYDYEENSNSKSRYRWSSVKRREDFWDWWMMQGCRELALKREECILLGRWPTGHAPWRDYVPWCRYLMNLRPLRRRNGAERVEHWTWTLMTHARLGICRSPCRDLPRVLRHDYIWDTSFYTTASSVDIRDQCRSIMKGS